MALIRSVFQDELDGVSQTLLDLANMVSESMGKATDSILNVDLKVAEEVIKADTPTAPAGRRAASAPADRCPSSRRRRDTGHRRHTRRRRCRRRRSRGLLQARGPRSGT